MSIVPDQFSQNKAPTYPPGLPRTPGGSVIFVAATPPPATQDAAAILVANAAAAAAAANVSPLVINDTFDGDDPTPYPRLPSTPPLTQPPRAENRLGLQANVAVFGAPSQEGSTGTYAGQRTVYPSAQDAVAASAIDSLPSSWLGPARPTWGATQTAVETPSSSPISVDWTASATESPSPTIRAASFRSQAAVSQSDAAVPDANPGHETQQANLAPAQAVSTPGGENGAALEASFDYFSLFSPPPIVDPTHYMGTSLQGADRTGEDPPPAPGQILPPPMVKGRVTGAFSGGAPHAFYIGEHQPPPSSIEHSKNAKKRLWPGSPNAEEMRRAERRQRADAPALGTERTPRSMATGLDGCNPWESERRVPASSNAGQLNVPGFAFDPVTTSTPAPDASTVIPSLSTPRYTQPPGLPQSSYIPPRDQAVQPTTDEPSEDVAQSVHPQESQAGELARNKGKGRAPDAPQEPDNEYAPEGRLRHDGDGWCDAEILEARQRSLRQTLGDRVNGRNGMHAPGPSQTAGAGPSNYRREEEGRNDPSDAWDQHTRYAPVRSPLPRHENYSYHQPRSEHAGRRRESRHDLNSAIPEQRVSRAYRERSAYVPLPNTRAAQFMADQETEHQRTLASTPPPRPPLSRISDLQHLQSRPTPSRGRAPRNRRYNENVSPSPSPRQRDISRVQLGRDHDDMDQDVDSREQDAWSGEEGELVPSALRDDNAGIPMEPTAPPDGSFPTIFRDDPEAGLRGMATDWIREMWSDPANTVILVDVFNYRYTEDDAYNRRVEEGIRRAIEYITGESGFDVVPPELEDGVRGRASQLPTLWAIRGLTPAGSARALELRTWSYPFISFHTSPRTTTISRWVMMLEGFLNDNERNIRSAILRVLEEADMRGWIERMVAANPDFADWPIDRAVDTILRSLRIETMQLGNGNYVTNVFIRSPTRDLREWRRWMADLRSRRYRSFANGTGRVRYVAACGGCRSVSHPMHLCPFPRVRGWQGPAQGQGVFGERAQSNENDPQPPTSGRSNAQGGRQNFDTRHGRPRDRGRSSPRRDDRSSNSAGPSNHGREQRGPRPGKGSGSGKGPGKRN